MSLHWTGNTSFKDLHAAMLLVVYRVAYVYEANGVPELWITSGNDSTHMKGSKHYEGKALDFRVHGIPQPTQQVIAKAVQEALSPEFFVLLEDSGKANEHLHVEFRG